MLVNSEATPEKLSEEPDPMGTEVQDIPKTWGQRMVDQGWEKGHDEGRREKQVEIARTLLAKGMPPAEVAEATDLPLDEVQTVAQ